MRPSHRELLRASKAPVMLVTDITNIRYLTGIALSAGSLLVLPRMFALFVDGRYIEEAARATRADVRVRSDTRLRDVLDRIRRCAFEADAVTVRRLSRWQTQYPNVKFLQTSGLVEEFRRSKDSRELRALQRAKRITEELLRRVPSALRRRTTERELAWRLSCWAQELGAERLSFDPIVAFGTHTSRPHHRPTNRELRKGHIVQVDVGAVYDGYCADLSAVYYTGKPPPIVERAAQAVRDAKDAAIRAVRTGASTRALDRIARDTLKRAGFAEAFCHALGHGVGMEVHEGVTLSQGAPEKTLLPGEVITIEPGVYFPGKFGIRLEDMIVVA